MPHHALVNVVNS